MTEEMVMIEEEEIEGITGEETIGEEEGTEIGEGEEVIGETGREVGQGVVVGGDEALPTGACHGAKTGPSQGPDPSCWVFVQYWYYNDDAHESNLVILRVHFVSTDYFISKKIVMSHQASFEWVCKLSSVIQWSMLAYGKFAHIIRSRIAFRYECS